MSEWSVQDWGAFIGAVAAVCGGILWLTKWLNKKLKKPTADMRVNFFKVGKSWRFRIYNSSEEDIEALNIKVYFPEEDEYAINWDSSKEQHPSLKRHGSFDIVAHLYTTSPRHTTVRLEWNQAGSKKLFTTSETVALK